MKLGTQLTDPVTGTRGFVSRFIGQYAVCRAADGTSFRVSREMISGGRKSHYAAGDEVKVLPPDGSQWLAGKVVSIAPLRVVVTERDPIWHGAELATCGKNAAKVRMPYLADAAGVVPTDDDIERLEAAESE